MNHASNADDYSLYVPHSTSISIPITMSIYPSEDISDISARNMETTVIFLKSLKGCF